MKLADALAEEPEPTPKAWCQVGLLRSRLDAPDNDALTEAFKKIMATSSSTRKAGLSPYTFQWLREVLAKNGQPIGTSSLRRHVKGECACGSI